MSTNTEPLCPCCGKPIYLHFMPGFVNSVTSSQFSVGQAEIPFSELEIDTPYLIDCHAEWDTDGDTAVLDGLRVAQYLGRDKYFYYFEDNYGTELHFEVESDDLRHVYNLPGKRN